MSDLINVAVVYHSSSGHTARMAEAAAEGAEDVAGTRASLIRLEGYAVAWESLAAQLAAADAIIFGCPTHMGSVSAPFKAFMDASVRAWQAGAWRDKVAGAFVCSANPSGDKLQSLQQLAVFAAQHGMIWVGLDVQGDPHGEEGGLNRLGSWLGAMGQAEPRASVVDAPPAGDLRTAAYLGRRLATAAARWRRGQGGVLL